MKALAKKTKITLIVAAVAVVLLLLLLVLFLPELIQPALWTLLILGVGFFLVEWYFRAKKRGKQRDFDERVAAKEGIEDRKREWAGWIEELDRQGIDRYELPFYLIVGEPQSGKSVLLQNSDLYFPFGQERLSGVGGTRGCDWWFTDEAVILDIAGRLFTHEGGVADKLEWEAFLDQLNAFRPLCPANGVLLVVPCDALLEDSPEVCADKANKIQSALLTLTQKLQAQLPVYLVLTKADRIFGFAESVHRLDGEERHQMFGWSRDASRAEQSFSLDEAKAGFAGLVGRARSLRERMIASARLPEALPEIDRLYAFPDEFAGMYRSLEIYLQRIFTQSSLVDRAAFRGIYLTSGLQMGAPVARVCADLIGGDRESDARALESLFSHQRAYFIKDLIKQRVFAERGLVRPTEGRLLAARRNAFIGYGAAAALAAVAVAGSAFHLLQDRSTAAERAFRAALEAGRSAVRSGEVRSLMHGLHEVDTAVRLDRDLMHEVFQSTRESFEELYAKLCDRALVPALRRALEERMTDRAAEEPVSYQQLLELLHAATPLYAEIDFASRDTQDLVKKWLAADWSIRVAGAAGGQVDFTVKDALDRRSGPGGPVSPVGDRTRLEALARRLMALLNRAIDPTTPWMARGHLGYMAAWRGAQESLKGIGPAQSLESPELLRLCDVFANSVRTIDEIVKSAALADGAVTNLGYMRERTELASIWATLAEFVGSPGGDDGWGQLKLLDGFARPIFDSHQSQEQLPKLSLLSGVFGRFANQFQQDLMGTMLAKVPVPSGDVALWLNDGGGEYAAARTAPTASWTLDSIDGVLGPHQGKLSSLYTAKVKVMAAQLAERVPDFAAARADYHRDRTAPPDGSLDQRSLAALAALRRDLDAYGLGTSPAALHVSKLLEEHLRAVDAVWAERDDWGTKVDWSVPMALMRVAADPHVGAAVAGIADQLCWQYVNAHEGRLLREWTGREDRADQTLVIAAALNEHLARLGELEGAYDPSQPVTLENPEHRQWLERVDADLSARLAKHLEALEGYWRPDTSAWSDLGAAAAGAKEALTAQAVRKKIVEARKSVDAPAADAAELRSGQPIAVTTSLPGVAGALAALRAFTVPSETDVRNHALAVKLRTVIGQVEQQLAADNGKALAAIALEMAPLAPPAAETTTVEHYLRPLYQAVRDRLVGNVRSRYLRVLAQTVFARGPAVMEGLYARTVAEIGAVEDQDVIRRLGLLLDPDGQLDQVRRDYFMVADPENPQAPHLRPGDGFRPPAADADWWQFEGFLIGLQAFLAGGERKVADAAFRVRFELPARAAGVWDIEETGKQFCYYAAHSAGKGNPGFASYGDDWSALEAPLEWEFHTTKRPAMWFVWTHKLRTQRFKWPGDRLAEDLSFELTGCLAPLLLAWNGIEDAGWWVVESELADTTEKARLRLSFVGVDGDDLVLPARPATRPSPY